MNKRLRVLQLICIAIILTQLSCTHVVSNDIDNVAGLSHRESLKALIYIQRRLAEQHVTQMVTNASSGELALAQSYCNLASYGVVHFEKQPELCSMRLNKRHRYCSNAFLNCLQHCKTRSSMCSHCEMQLTQCVVDKKNGSFFPTHNGSPRIVPKG